MENNYNEQVQNEVMQAVKQLLSGEKIPDLEESLFQIYEEAYIFGEPDADERARRALLHYTLRKIFRLLRENPELLTQILKT